MTDIRPEVLDLCACFEAAGRMKAATLLPLQAKLIYEASCKSGFLKEASLPIHLTPSEVLEVKRTILKAAAPDSDMLLEKAKKSLSTKATTAVTWATCAYKRAIEFGLIKEDFTM